MALSIVVTSNLMAQPSVSTSDSCLLVINQLLVHARLV